MAPGPNKTVNFRASINFIFIELVARMIVPIILIIWLCCLFAGKMEDKLVTRISVPFVRRNYQSQVPGNMIWHFKRMHNQEDPEKVLQDSTRIRIYTDNL